MKLKTKYFSTNGDKIVLLDEEDDNTFAEAVPQNDKKYGRFYTFWTDGSTGSLPSWALKECVRMLETLNDQITRSI